MRDADAMPRDEVGQGDEVAEGTTSRSSTSINTIHNSGRRVGRSIHQQTGRVFFYRRYIRDAGHTLVGQLDLESRLEEIFFLPRNLQHFHRTGFGSDKQIAPTIIETQRLDDVLDFYLVQHGAGGYVDEAEALAIGSNQSLGLERQKRRSEDGGAVREYLEDNFYDNVGGINVSHSTCMIM